MLWLRQSTAVTVKIGPFVDSTDGNTVETALTIAQADVRLSKNGANIAQKNESTSCTHDELGIYGCPLDTTDTGTLGRLQLWVHESGALPVWHEFVIVPANVWDSLFGSDMLKVDVHAIDDDETAANNLESYCDGTTPQPVNATQISADAAAADNLELFTEIANITSLTVDAAGHLECDVVEIEGADPTDTIRDAVVDDATRIDASALNTLSGHDPGSTLCADGTPLTAAETESEVNDALVALDLDHFIQVSAGAEEPTDGSYLDQIMHKAGGQTFDATTDSLEAIRDTAPLGTAMRGTDSAALASVCTEARLAELAAANLPADVDAILADTNELQTDDTPGAIAGLNDPTAAAVADAVWDELSTGHVDAGKAGQQLWTDLDAALADTNELQTDDIPGLIAALNDISTAQVNTEVDTALSDIHLDHLLAADYDPASKPGTATALLNEIIESDAGVSRFTENALEQAPSGTGASAASIADAVWDEAKSGHTGVGSFGEEVQAHATSLGLVVVTSAIEADTQDIQNRIPAALVAGRMSSDAVAISGSTAAADNVEANIGNLDAGIAALNDIAVTDITQRQIPDSVPADGTLPTIEQALYMITQFLHERAVSGTTVTVKKVDGSTSLLTLTLDDGTDPTSITRSG